MTFSAQILIALATGILTGVVLGERAAALKWAADGFVKLLQMTVLPYVTLSIIGGLGALRISEARALAWRVGAVLAGLWALVLVFTLLVPLTFPRVENAAFFSTTLVEQAVPFNFVDLYIPANPFYSLANNVVPAVVLFSVMVGLALIGVPDKNAVLVPLAVAASALSRATRFVVSLTPFGIFAITANTAGTLSLEQLGRLQVYVVAYVLVALLVSLWVLPGLVAVLTGIRVRDIFALTRTALVTAFVAGDLFIVLPVLIGASRALLEGGDRAGSPVNALPEVIVPASFNFPHAGKLLSLSFVLFAGWFADAVVPVAEYPRLALTGLVTFFGSLNVAVPFMLDHFRIPADTFQLFLASGVINSRFGTLVAAVHTVSVALLGTCAMSGRLRWRRGPLLRYAAVTAALTVVTIGGTRAVFARALDQSYTKDKVLAGMQLLRRPVPAVVHREAPPAADDDGAGYSGGQRGDNTGDVLAAVKARGTLRVGYLSDSLPFAFFNGGGDLVGFDIELAHRLAAELQVTLEFLPVERETMPARLAAGYCDIVMSGVVLTPLRASAMLFSSSYLDETLGLIVEDGRRDRFTSWPGIQEAGPLALAVPNLTYYADKVHDLAPGATVRRFTDIKALLDTGAAGVDAIVYPAERASAWTLLYPRYSVVVPEPARIRVPLAYPIGRNDQAFVSFVNSWVELKRKDGTMDGLYDHWILGRNAVPVHRRWSVVDNLLHWDH